MRTDDRQKRVGGHRNFALHSSSDCLGSNIIFVMLCSDEIQDHQYIFQDVKLTEAEEKELR